MPDSNVLQDKREKMRRESSPEIQSEWTTFERVCEYHYRESQRCLRNWRMYWAQDPELGLGQWPAEAVSEMLAQRRQLTQFNMTMTTVDTIAGGMAQMQWDPKYYPVNHSINSLTKLVQKMMYSEKELMDWQAEFFQLFRAGLIHEGVVKMSVSDRWDPLGNILFQYCLPGSVRKDPAWRSWSGYDMQQCWHESWLSWETMYDTYPEWREQIEASVNSIKAQGHEYGFNNGVTGLASIYDFEWGSYARVVERFYLCTERKKIEFAIDVDENGLPFETVIPETLKETADKIAWLNANAPGWQPDKVFEREVKTRVCKVKTLCPALSLTNAIAHGPTELQIERLPFFFYSASRAHGETHSVVDSMIDVQQTVNYWESLLIHKLQTEGGGGSQFMDPSKFANNQIAQDYRENRNDPKKTFDVAPGALDQGQVAVPTRKSEFPNEAFQHLQHLIDTVAPWVSKVTRVTRGEREGQGDSGKLFELMKIQSDQQLYTIHYGLKLLYNEIYEAYLLAASCVHGRWAVPRRFAIKGGTEDVIANQIIQKPDGTIAVRNDLSRLRTMRHKVIVSEMGASPTDRLAEIGGLTQMLKFVPDAKMATKHFMVSKALSKMDVFGSDEDREVLDKIGKAELEVILQDMATKTALLKVQEIEAGMRAKQMVAAAAGGAGPEQMAGAGGPPPPQGGGGGGGIGSPAQHMAAPGEDTQAPQRPDNPAAEASSQATPPTE